MHILLTFKDEWNRNGDDEEEQNDAEDAFENINAQNQEQGAREDDGESTVEKRVQIQNYLISWAKQRLHGIQKYNIFLLI